MAQHDIATILALGHAETLTLSGTVAAHSTIYDLRDYEGAVFGVSTGTVTDAGTAAGFTVRLQHSDTLAAADFADVPAAEHTGALTVTADTADNVPVGKIGYIGGKRYVRVSGVGTTATDAAVLVYGVLGSPRYAPTPATVAKIAAT